MILTEQPHPPRISEQKQYLVPRNQRIHVTVDQYYLKKSTLFFSQLHKKFTERNISSN